MNYYTISKVEALFRMQRLVASSACRFFSVGEVNASQLADIIRMFEKKYNVSADENERKRLDRAGEPIWHCVWWYDYIKTGSFYYYLFSTGFKPPKNVKKVFDVSKRNAELIEKERLKDLYNGDLLTFGRYVLGQYIDYESPYDKRTKDYPKEYRHPEQIKDIFNPKEFNFVRQGNYYRSLPQRLEKLKQRYASEQTLIKSSTLSDISIDQSDKDLHTENDPESHSNIIIETDVDIIESDNNLKSKSPEYIAAENMIRDMRRKHIYEAGKYLGNEINPKQDIDLISELHPNFRSDLNFTEIRERVASEIIGLEKRVNRISREAFIHELGKLCDAKSLHTMSHSSLKDLWLNVNKRRVHLYYNRLCEDRTRTIRWTWYVRSSSVWDMNQQMKYAIRHMGRGGDEFIRALQALYRMAGFHGVRHQVGRLVAKAKRDAKHAYPKIFNGIDVPNSFNFITTVPITIGNLKEFHDEAITSSIKHLRVKKGIAEREAQRGAYRKALREQSEVLADQPTHVIDQLINQEFNKRFTANVTAEEIYEFLKKHDDMNPMYLDLNAINELLPEQSDHNVIFDSYERYIHALKNPKPTDGESETMKTKSKPRVRKSKSKSVTSEAIKPETDTNENEVESEDNTAES